MTAKTAVPATSPGPHWINGTCLYPDCTRNFRVRTRTGTKLTCPHCKRAQPGPSRLAQLAGLVPDPNVKTARKPKETPPVAPVAAAPPPAAPRAPRVKVTRLDAPKVPPVPARPAAAVQPPAAPPPAPPASTKSWFWPS